MIRFLVFLLLASTVSAAEPKRCRIGKIAIRVHRVNELCGVNGIMSFRALYWNVNGARLDVDACAVDAPTWGSNPGLELDSTGFRASMGGLVDGEHVPISIAVTQGERSFFVEKVFVY